MLIHRRLLAAASLPIACVPLIFAATPQQVPVFRTEATVVPIYATVTRSDGRILSDLTSDHFRVLDNGTIRPISVFSDDPAPIVGLALWDQTVTMRPSYKESWHAAVALVDALWEGDTVRFGAFNGFEFWVSPIATGNKATLRRIIDQELWFGAPAGTSPLWAALTSAVGIVSKESGRRVLLVLTAGQSMRDRGSRQEAVRQVQRADTMVYAVGFRQSGLTRQVRDLAEGSGGGYAELPQDADLPSEFRRIVAELHHQYLLGFLSDASDGTLHTLEVRVTVPGAKVRARRSYVAAGPR